jgi:hypothetical protein
MGLRCSGGGRLRGQPDDALEHVRLAPHQIGRQNLVTLRSAGTPFVVEGSAEIDGKAYVFARALVLGADFALRDGSAFDGRLIERWLDVPRAGPNGEPRLDLFAFCLKTASDRDYFTTGLRILLTP